ncbi:hypothetical protein C3L33_05050, partial [Rhododendron williamsianum]
MTFLFSLTFLQKFSFILLWPKEAFLDHPVIPLNILLIHGLVDRVMEAIGCQFVQSGDNAGYYLERADEPEFLPGRQASIIYKGKRIGAFGIVHPEVLNNFDIPDACSFVELNIESFLQSQVS